jgi:hypothetical protein
MAKETAVLVSQNTIRNNFALVRLPDDTPDGLHWWAEQYFQFEVTTSPASQKVQRRDLMCHAGCPQSSAPVSRKSSSRWPPERNAKSTHTSGWSRYGQRRGIIPHMIT